jgi:hypothetical protein
MKRLSLFITAVLFFVGLSIASNGKGDSNKEPRLEKNAEITEYRGKQRWIDKSMRTFYCKDRNELCYAEMTVGDCLTAATITYGDEGTVHHQGTKVIQIGMTPEFNIIDGEPSAVFQIIPACQ